LAKKADRRSRAGAEIRSFRSIGQSGARGAEEEECLRIGLPVCTDHEKKVSAPAMIARMPTFFRVL